MPTLDDLKRDPGRLHQAATLLEAENKKLLAVRSRDSLCDGYSAYQSLKKRRHDFKLAHCWAHARRKFVEIEESFPKQSAEALGLIAELYRIEREIEDKSPDERLRIRAARAGPVVQQIHRWALGQRALPQSRLGKSIDYLGKHFEGLRVFLTDPKVPLDNNRTERAPRGVVVS